MRIASRSLTLWIILLITGCSFWNPSEPDPAKPIHLFPQPRIPLDAVGLELAVVRIDEDQLSDFEEFWSVLDEQEIPLVDRKKLDANGIRIGVMSSNPPAIFQTLVEPRAIQTSELKSYEKQIHDRGMLEPRKRMVEHRQISNREGQAYLIPTSGLKMETSWTIADQDHQSVGSGELVQGHYSITTYPSGDGSVNLVLRPEIHHGETRSRIGVAERNFRFEETQTIEAIDELKLKLALRLGESVVLAPTEGLSFTTQFESNTLGEVLFSPLDDPNLLGEVEPVHQFLVVRISQTQRDDLFSSNEQFKKLTTTPKY
ncbi:MAG: hypothetical protein AAF623_00470 [Planctomycetota bacterium]